MDSLEIESQLEVSYDDLVEYLLCKYGRAQYDYFCNELCKSKNRKVIRTDEGLICHHIDEDKVIMLSNDKNAIKHSFDHQKADRLVYCNVLEHLILHIKIVEEREEPSELQGFGGAVGFICPQINDYFNGYEFKQPYLVRIYSLIQNNFEDYINILKYFLAVIEDKPIHRVLTNKETLSVGWDGQTVKRVYDKL